MKKVAEFLLFLLGLFLFYLVIRGIEASPLQILLPVLGKSIWILFAVYPLMCVWDVIAWKTAFGSVWARQIRLVELFSLRLAGEAVNNVTPVFDVGGEPLKALLASKRFNIPMPAALAASVVGRTALFLSEIIFMLIGASAALFFTDIPGTWRWIFFGCIIVFVTAALFFFAMQKKGFFGIISKIFNGIRRRPALAERLHVSSQTIDDEIRSFYKNEPRRFAASVLFHFIGWVLGSFEMALIFYLLGKPINLGQAFLLESLLQLVRTASFFIPGNLGTQEAGLALLTFWIGYAPAVGVAVSLLKRLRQIFWTGIGFGLWGIYQLKRMMKPDKAQQ